MWIHALHRICIDNQLFRPSFPIQTMSDIDLEKAATAPLRWIAISKFTQCRTRRIIRRPARFSELEKPNYSDEIYPYLVPGGRYLVTSSFDFLAVWDLGYTSDAVVSSSDWEPLRVWSVPMKTAPWIKIHPSPDGSSLRIVSQTST